MLLRWISSLFSCFHPSFSSSYVFLFGIAKNYCKDFKIKNNMLGTKLAKLGTKRNKERHASLKIPKNKQKYPRHEAAKTAG